MKIPEKMDEDMEKYMKRLGYANFSEFARTSIKEKPYGPESPKSAEKDLDKLETYLTEKNRRKIEDTVDFARPLPFSLDWL